MSALGKLGQSREELKNSIKDYLQKYYLSRRYHRYMRKAKNEVKDRLALYLRAMDAEGEEKTIAHELAFPEPDLDVTALEAYIQTHRKELASSDKLISIDLKRVFDIDKEPHTYQRVFVTG